MIEKRVESRGMSCSNTQKCPEMGDDEDFFITTYLDFHSSCDCVSRPLTIKSWQVLGRGDVRQTERLYIYLLSTDMRVF